MDKNAKFGPNLVGFGQKILIITGKIKSFASFRINKDFWPNLAQKMVSLAHIGVAGSFGALVGWLVVVARAVSCKTPIYFKVI